MPIDLSQYYEDEPTSSIDLSQYYETEEEEPESFLDELSGAISSGYRNMKAGSLATGYIGGAVAPETVARSFIDAIKSQPETPEYAQRFIDKAMAEGNDIETAEGFWETGLEILDAGGEMMLEAITNPKGLAHLVAGSAAQSLPALGFGAAGAIGGTSVAGPAGGIAGLAGGTVIGTFAVEAGGHLQKLVSQQLVDEGRSLQDVTEQDIVSILENKEFTDWAEAEAAKRGLSVAAIEGIFSAFGGKLLSGAGKSVFSKAGRAAGDIGVETIGEMTGEAAGQLATGEEISAGEIILEGAAGLGQSTGTTAIGALARRRPGQKSQQPSDTLDSMLDTEEGDISGDALDQALGREAAPTEAPTEAPTQDQETQDAMALVSQYSDLEDTVAGFRQQGMLEDTIVYELFQDALATNLAVRTEGQKALIKMGREAERRVQTPINKLRTEDQAKPKDVIQPLEEVMDVEQIKDDAIRATPDFLRGEADRTFISEREKVVEEKVKPAPEKVKQAPKKVEVSPEIVKPVPEKVEAPSEEVKPAPSELETIEAEIKEVTAAAPKGIPAVKEKRAKLDDLSVRKETLVKKDIDDKAQEAQTSEVSDLPQPTEAQIEAGNYKKGHVKVQGLDISIENPKGSTRSGVAPDGKKWSTTMKDHYGYIKRTEGADGDQVDVFIGDYPESEKVFIVDQVNPSTGKFDEHKVVLGAKTANQAKMFYNRNYDKGWKGAGAVTEMSMDEFKTWLKEGDTKKPVKGVVKEAAPKELKMPKEISSGMLVFKTKPLTGKLYRVTSMEGITTLLRETLTNTEEQGTITSVFVADSSELAFGQGKNVQIEFDGSLVSGEERIKPGTGIKGVTGKEYKTDYINKDAITAFTIPKGLKLKGISNVFANRQFNKVVNDDGTTTYTRKDLAVKAPKPKKKQVKVTKPKPVKREATKVKDEVEKKLAPKKSVSIGKDIEPQPEQVSIPTSFESALRKGSLHDALGNIRDNTALPEYKAIIDRILPHIPDSLNVNVIAIGDKVSSKVFNLLSNARGAIIKDRTGRMDLYLKDETFTAHGLIEETIVHESIHAATMELINIGNIRENINTPLGKSVQELYKLQNTVMKYLNDRISSGKATKWEKDRLTGTILQDVDEVVAWGLSNASFQAYLKSIPYTKRDSVWSKFTKTLAKILGIDSKDHNAFTELLEVTNTILNEDYRQTETLRKKMMGTSKTTPSFKHAQATIEKSFNLAQLETQRTGLDFERANRLDIASGKKLKELESEIKILKQEIQDERKEDKYFDEGKENVDIITDRITAKPKQLYTIHERITKWGAEHDVNADSIRTFIGESITDIYAIERMEVEAFGARRSAEKSATSLSMVSKNAQVSASIATTKFGLKLIDNDVVIDHDQPGLEKILEPVAKLGNKYLRLWESWAVVKRSERLIEEGRERFVLDTDIKALQEYVNERPNLKTLFEATHAEYQKFNKSMLQLAIDAGYINEQDAFGGYRLVQGEDFRVKSDGTWFESAADAKEHAVKLKGEWEVQAVDGWYHDDYVPFNRLDDKTDRVKGLSAAGKIGQVRKGVIGLKGGIGKIPVLENMTKNISFLVSGSMRTVAMREAVDMSLNVAVEKIEETGEAPMIDRETAIKALNEIGIPAEGMSMDELQRWQRMMSSVRPMAQDSVVVYRNGRPHYYRVLEPGLLSALKAIGPNQAKEFFKVIGIPTRILSKSITLMPPFLARNLMREIQNAYIINEKIGINPFETLNATIKNFGKLLKKDNPEMMAMMAAGAVSFNSYYKAAPDDVRQRLLDMGVKKSAMRKIVESPWSATKNLWQLYMRVAVATEHAARLTIRDSYLKAGSSVAEANYQGLDVLNHTRRGDGMGMQFLLAVIPFLNPRIQGFDRLYRGAKSNWQSMAMKSGLLAIASFALASWNWEENEEEMNKLKEEDKDMFFHFFLDTGGAEKEHWRIPKGFEIGQIAGTFPERLIEQIRTDQPEAVSKSLRRFLMMTFGLQFPQFMNPALEVGMNEDFFRQRPIISFGQQFAPTKMQYDVWTSQAIIDLAHNMPDSAPEWARSPKKLEHLFKGYLGPMGALVLEGTSNLYQMTGNAPDAPTKALAQTYFVRDFYRSGVERSSRSVNRFYSMTEEVGKLAVGLKAARENSMSEYREMRIDNKEKIRVRNRLNKMSKRMREYNIRIRKIMASETMSGDLKFTKIQILQRKKNEVAGSAVDKYWHIFE